MVDLHLFGASLRSFILDNATVNKLCGAKRVHEDHVPQLPPGDHREGYCDGNLVDPYVWFSMSSANYEGCLDAAPGTPPDEIVYDIEAFASRQEDAKQLGWALRNHLHDYRGQMGGFAVQLIDVTDHDNDYLARGRNADVGLFESTMSVEITPLW